MRASRRQELFEAAVAEKEARPCGDSQEERKHEGLPDGEYTAVASGYPPAASTLHIAEGEGTVRHDIELKHTQADIHPKHARGRRGAVRLAGRRRFHLAREHQRLYFGTKQGQYTLCA